MWEALCREVPQLRALRAGGAHTVDAEDGVTVRWVRCATDESLAVEVIDLPRKDWWQAYVVTVADGSMRTGWRRRGNVLGAPAAWESAAIEMHIEATTVARAEPEFLTLALLMGCEESLVVDVHDLEQRRSLAVECEHWREQNRRQTDEIRRLQSVIEAINFQPANCGDLTLDFGRHDVPDRMDALEGWAKANADRIVILPRALASAKRSVYENPKLVFMALEWLAGTYRLAKTGKSDRQQMWTEIRALGLELSGSTSSAGEEGDTYYVQYGGRRRFLDLHLKRGTSRDPRYTLRIYFTWSAEEQMVLVGSLPGHLDNALT